MNRFLPFSIAVALSLVIPTAGAEEETAPVPETVPLEPTEATKRQRPSDPDSPAIVREPRTPTYKPYWYFDGGLGYSDFSEPVITVTSSAGPVSTSFDRSGDDFVLRILGGYQLNAFFALETGLAGFGGDYREDFIVTGTPTTTGGLTFRGIEAQVTVPADHLSRWR